MPLSRRLPADGSRIRRFLLQVHDVAHRIRKNEERALKDCSPARLTAKSSGGMELYSSRKASPPTSKVSPCSSVRLTAWLLLMSTPSPPSSNWKVDRWTFSSFILTVFDQLRRL